MTQAKRTPPRLLEVVHVEDLSPSMRRIHLSGEQLNHFPHNSDGAHIKLMLPQAHQQSPVLPTLGEQGPIWPEPHERPIVRTYTVAKYDERLKILAVDFVKHGDNGSASKWAIQAQIGQKIGVAGPAQPARHDATADYFLLITDLSGLPAVRSVLAALPHDAKGQVWIEVQYSVDVIALTPPKGVRVHWLMRGQGLRAGDSRLLLEAVQKLPWDKLTRHGKISVTLAGESAQVVAIRDFLRHERHIPRTQMYAVPYWKDEQTEEQYHAERHKIMDEMDAS